MNRLIPTLLWLLALVTPLAAEPSQPAVQPRQGPLWIGVTTQPATGPLRAQLALPANRGIVVRSVAADSPAAKAGLQINDLLLSADQKPLSRPRDLARILSQVNRDTMPIEFLRQGRRKKVIVQPLPRRKAARPITNNQLPNNEQRFLQNILNQIAPLAEGDPKPQGQAEGPQGQTQPRIGGGRLLSNLPDNFRITLHRNNGGPPRFVVENEGQRWEVDGSRLSQWGQALLPLAEGLLGSNAAPPPPPNVEALPPDQTLPPTDIPLPTVELPSELPPLLEEKQSPAEVEN